MELQPTAETSCIQCTGLQDGSQWLRKKFYGGYTHEKYDNELIAWVMVSTTEDEPLYQFTAAFVDEASDLISSDATV